MNPAAAAAAPLEVAVAPAAEFVHALPASVLCAFQAGGCSDDDPRRIVLPLATLLGADRVELWQGGGAVECGYDGDFAWSRNREALMLQLRIPEAALEPIEDRVCALYRRIGAFAAARGYPQLWRMWHYLGSIGQGAGDAERYRRFCVGRHLGLAGQPGFEARLPAATAVGAAGGGLMVVALAGRRPGEPVENPQQLSAYRYPRAYGPRSPSFARATLLKAGAELRLLVSGTASIVGHRSLHHGDPALQLQQIMRNLAALTQALPGRPQAALRPLSGTVYLRHPGDLPRLAAPLAGLFGDAPLRVFQAEICRPELLLEIELVYGAP